MAALLAAWLLGAVGVVGAAEVALVAEGFEPASALDEYTLVALPALDLRQEFSADEKRVLAGDTAHFAAVLEVDVDPWSVGSWSVESSQLEGRRSLDSGNPPVLARWRARIRSAGALSLSLAFRNVALPDGARLILTSADGRFEMEPFTAADQEEHGQLWTPPMPTEDLLLDLILPVDRLEDLRLDLWRVHHGYAGFGEAPEAKAGGCHLDVACVESAEWSEASTAVGLVTIDGVRFCTGFLINNTARDRRPLFVTGAHCGVDASNAASVVVMWDFARPTCAKPAQHPESRYFQTGARFLARHLGADMALLELDDQPDPDLGLAYLGWDRSDADPVEAVAIHHPGASRKRLAVAQGPLYSTSNLNSLQRPGGNHLYVPSWSSGTTEGGSSGAPLLTNEARVVGSLHGGYAACDNQKGDWFGRLSAAWWGPSPEHRFRDWLDPKDTQAIVLDGLGPAIASSSPR